MWQNNKTEIQITRNAKFVIQIKQYLILCHNLLSINDQILIYLPYAEKPTKDSFQKLYSVQVTNRQSREIKAIHLASAYFSTEDNQRQFYLRYKFVEFLNNLRIVPPKIKILLQLEQLVREITRAINTINISLNKNNSKHNQQQNLQGVIRPNQIIRNCQQLSNALKKLSYSSSNSKISLISNLKTKNKSELQEHFLQKDFLLQPNFTTLLNWKYQACIIASLILLQKQCKERIIKFIKETKKLMKLSLIKTQTIIETYAFCLKNICDKKSSIENVQSYVYFQLQLKKLLAEKKNQLSNIVITKVQNIIKKVKQVTEEQVLKKYSEANQHQIKIFQNPTPTDNFIEKQQNTQCNIFTKITNKYTINLKMTKRSAFSIQNNNFVATNRFSLTSKSKMVGLSVHQESQSLNKIKQYQLSLRKARQLNENDVKKNVKMKEKTVRSMYDDQQNNQNKLQKEKNASQEKLYKNVSFALSKNTKKSFRLDTKRKGEEIKSDYTIKNSRHQQSRVLPMPFTQRLYQSLRQKNSNHQEITVMSLQNEIYYAPQVIYEKPKITFQQITRDFKSISQIKNDSQSNTIGQLANQIILAKIQTQVNCIIIINGRDMLTISIIKQKNETDKFFVKIKQNEQFLARLKFQQLEKSITLKSAKASIQSTDLFFQLMQTNVSQKKPEGTVKFLIETFNLSCLQHTDNQKYIGYCNVFNTISIMSDYIKPYLYWYWTRRSKMNGYTIGKREKLDMSDPLKFSINLQTFKKNDFQGCLEVFKTIRNKKGLKQCIAYLSQNRQILCRRLTKNNKGFFILETLQMQNKYMRTFQLSTGNGQLNFPIVKLIVKKFRLDEEYKTKNALLIQNALKKFFIGQNKKTLKKKSNQIITQQTQPSQIDQTIDMRTIFNNNQCNQIIINNLNQNFIPKRFIQKMLSYLQNNLHKEEQELKIIQKQILYREQEKKEKRVYEYETEENKFDLKKTQQQASTKTQSNNDLNEALRNYIISILGVENQNAFVQQLDSNSRREDRKNTRKITKKISNNHYLSHLDDNYNKLKYPLQYAINPKLSTFTNFLIIMSQAYEQSMMFSIKKNHMKKIKIGNMFFELEIYSFANECSFMIVRNGRNEKQWIVYVSQKILRIVDCLMMGEQEWKSCNEDGRVLNTILCSSQENKIIQMHPNSSKINFFMEVNKNENISNFCSAFTDPNKSQKIKVSFCEDNKIKENSQGDSLCINSQSSILAQQRHKLIKKVSQSQTLNKKLMSSHIPQIANSQSLIFNLEILKTPYYNKLAIHRKYTGKYFVNRPNSKNNKCSIMVCWTHNVFKKIVKLKDIWSIQKFNTKFERQTNKYAYFACGYDIKFNYWRLDIYLPSTQQKYVAYIVENVFTSCNDDNQNRCFDKLFTKIFSQNLIQLNLQNYELKIKEKSYKLFETFGQMTLPHKQISLQYVEYLLTSKEKTLNQLNRQTIPSLLKKNKSFMTEQHSSIKNSGLFELLKHKQTIKLLLLDYIRHHILVSQFQQDPQHLFTNVYAECSHKEINHVIYQNLLRRAYQKVQKNTTYLSETTIQQLSKFQS